MLMRPRRLSRPGRSLPPRSTPQNDRLRYAAAQVGRLVGDWFPVGQDVNALISRASPLVRERTRQLIRDFPPFAKAARELATYVVGTGIRFQSRASLGPKDRDKALRSNIEDAWDRWMESADVSGSAAFSQHFHELAALAKRQDVEQGEFFAVFQPHLAGRRTYLSMGIMFYESDRLASINVRAEGSNKIFDGVEYDARTGSPVAFHFIDDTVIYKTVRVPAEDVVFGLDRQRPEQLRGITPFAPGLLLARDLAMTMDAEIDAAKLASKWLAIVKTQDSEEFQKGRAVTSNGKQIESLENAIIEYLNPGEDIELKSHQRGGDVFQGFCRFVLRLIAITADIPYEILSGDYTGLNYTTLRVGRNDFMQQLAPIQRRHVMHFCMPVFRKVLDRAVLEGKLALPGYWNDPWRYWKGLWISPGMPEVDPLREKKAAVEGIKGCLGSPQEYIMSRGGDPDQVLDDIAAYRDACAERGLNFDAMFNGVNTASQNNPAALDEQDGETADSPNPDKVDQDIAAETEVQQ